MNGHLVGNGAMHTIGDLSIEAMISYVWWFFTRHAEDAERKQFEAKLWRPPTKETPIPKESPWSAENEMKGFEALKAETGA